MLSSKIPRLPWGVLAIEVAAIFLSVFLAFGVTEWRETRKEDALRRAALENFRDELARNRGRVAATLPYQEAMYGRISAVLQGRPDTLTNMGEAMQAIEWRGPGVVYLENAAWATAEATGALGLIDYPTASAISGAYDGRATLGDAQQRFLTETAYNPLSYSPEHTVDMLNVMNIYFDAASATSRALLRMHDAALARIHEALGEPVPDSLAAALAATSP